MLVALFQSLKVILVSITTSVRELLTHSLVGVEIVAGINALQGPGSADNWQTSANRQAHA